MSVDGELSFFVNGVSQGVAARQVYEEGSEVYCFVELVQGYGAVEITRAGTYVRIYVKLPVLIGPLPLPGHLSDQIVCVQ